MTNNRGLTNFFILFVLTTLAACGGTGGPPGLPATAITAQPTDQSVLAGTTATFDVVASNAAGYQWQRSTDNGTTFTDVSGATAASHTTAVTTLADSGTQYRVAVSGASNGVTSSAVTLTVTPVIVAPSISVQPTGQTITAGQDASFTVTASGSSLGYQWQEAIIIIDGGVNFVDMVGETNATLTLTALSLSDNARQFRVVVSNSVGSVTSNAALLTVNAAQTAPAFSSQPVNQSVVAPDIATFSVIVTGNPGPTLQWQLSTNAGGSFTDIAGATGSSYTTAATSTGDNGNQYRIIATNTAGAATSNAATLTVTVPSAPSFTAQPVDVTITEGQNAQFTVAVSGTPTPTLQWQLSTDNGGSWSNITGATATVFDVLNAALANNGRQFRAVASNTSGSATSLAAVLTVNPLVVPTFQFNLFSYNSGPAVFLLYGGYVNDDANTIQCSGYARLSDPCPKWRADYASGTLLRLTATAWPGWRVRGWLGGDCGSPGNATTVTLTIDHNSNCLPQFEVIPGSTFSVSAVPAGAWVGLVVEVVVDRFGNLVVPDAPRISCGPLASTQICEARVDIGASPYTVMRLRAVPLPGAPVGQLRWTCNSPSPENASTVVTQTVVRADIAIGPIYGNTACSADLIPTL